MELGGLFGGWSHERGRTVMKTLIAGAAGALLLLSIPAAAQNTK